MIALVRWLLSLVVLAVWIALIGTGLYMAMYEAPAETPEVQAIIVLGGNPPESGALTGQSAERMTHALALAEAGAAPLIVVTGGGTQPVAPAMAKAARDAGLAPEDILIEDASRSTLQDALFTFDMEMLDKTQPILIVSHRYHLPRAWASFRWAGFESVKLSAADPEGGLTLSGDLLWESVKWPVNLLRAGGASAAQFANLPRETWIKFLE